MKKLFLKISQLINEKRLIKTILKKLYPYYKGLIFTLTFQKSEIKLMIPNSNKIDETDLELAKKIFNSYKKMKLDQKKINNIYRPSSIWQKHIDEDFNFLIKSYEKNNVNDFLFFLQNFGNWNKYLGIENQTLLKKYNKNFLLRKFLVNEIFQGQKKIWDYINQNNSNLSSLNMPRYGNQVGAYIDNNFVVIGSFFNQIYSNIIRNYFKEDQKNIIVDLGGGYGKFAYYLLNNMNNYTFVDFDVPEVLTLACYYLTKSFPDKRYFFYGQEEFSDKKINNFDLFFLPSWEIEKLKDNQVDILINKNSLGEMNPETTKYYIKNIARITRYFFSLNHEFFRNEFDNKKLSLINKEFNDDKKFKILMRYPDFGSLLYENNKINLDSDIFFYIYEKIQKNEH